MKSSQAIIFIILLCFVFVGNYLAKNYFQGDRNGRTEVSLCRLTDGECQIGFFGSYLDIHVEGEIQALQRFNIVITDSENIIHSANIRLQMKAMDMGFNEFVFNKETNHQWRAGVVIPVCTTGRRDWLFEITVFDGSKKLKTVFEVEF